MSGVFARRARRAIALGVAGLGACTVLAACAPVKMGAAAIVGNQRITVSSLDAQVADLQAAAKPYGAQVVLADSQMPGAVLTWLIRFDIVDQMAADHGISVTHAQVQQGIAAVNAQARSGAAENGLNSTTAYLLNLGITPQMMPAAGRWEAQEVAYVKQVNGGKMPTTAAENNSVTAQFTKSQCTAAKALNIQVSPAFGRLDYTRYLVVPGPDTLSRPAGTPSPAPTEGLVPAC